MINQVSQPRLKGFRFSDSVFDQIAAFASGEMGPDHWVGQIEAVEV